MKKDATLNGMKKIILGITISFVALTALFYALNSYIYHEKQGVVSPQHFKDITFGINGMAVTLKNGISEVPAAEGSASLLTTRYFGNEVSHDVDGDGVEDTVFLVTQNSGGSGTFFYVVAALKKDGGYVGSQAMLLGDRIAPQTTEKGPGRSVIVNYAERKQGEPMTASPSVGKSMRLLLDPTTLQFGEVVQDFEGEADPSRMTLSMTTWRWQKVLYNDGREMTPKEEDKFTLTLSQDETFSATTDCNSMSGTYRSTANTITFGSIAMTKMFCEGSEEAEFAALLQNVSGYHFTSKGELILDLASGGGSVIFR